MNRLIFFFFALTPVASIAQQEKKEGELTIPEYITKYSGLAQENMRRTGIPASITLAQGILESNFGNSKLARKANNHFGIKCGNNWDGPTFIQDDDEDRECFRKYESVYHSFRDHSNFLVGKERYAFLFKLSPKDYKGWANGLQKAGYATNPNYANLLIRLIEERNLHIYDTQEKYTPLTAEEAEYLKSMDNQFFVFNGIKTVISQPNDMAMDLANKYDISLHQLLSYNDMKEGDYIPPGSKIYLQPKRTKGYEVYHRVAEGETMHAISQKQGIKLKSLYKKNRMTWGEEPAVAEILCLRKKCSSPPKLKTDEEIKKDIQQDIQKRVNEAVKQEQKKEPVMEKPESEKAAILSHNEDTLDEKLDEELEEKPEISSEVAIQGEPPSESKAAPAAGTVSSPAGQPKYHKVAPQETIYKICTKYKVSAEEIRKWNRLTSNNLSIGQLLIVGYTTNLAEDAVEDKDAKLPENPELSPASPAQKTLKYHVVGPKETLYRISTIYRVTVDDLKKWNNLLSNELSIGQRLIVSFTEETPRGETENTMEKIPDGEPPPAEIHQEPSPGQPTYHKVQEGETLYTLSQKYKISVDDLKRLNNLVTNDIRPGQVLKLR